MRSSRGSMSFLPKPCDEFWPFVDVNTRNDIRVGHCETSLARCGRTGSLRRAGLSSPEASPWPAFSMRSRSSDEKRRQGAISYSSRFHLSEPFGRGDALNRLADATVEPVRDTLG